MADRDTIARALAANPAPGDYEDVPADEVFNRPRYCHLAELYRRQADAVLAVLAPAGDVEAVAREMAVNRGEDPDQIVTNDRYEDEPLWCSFRPEARWHLGRLAAVRTEADQLRSALRRVTDAAGMLATELTDPGPEALTAIHCAREALRTDAAQTPAEGGGNA
ncbi:conserved protein of unknown function [Rhodovastum atsumiense]|uniref:Uncharacterized protein n=1 Tax=Rhodovastum atsumiense TaxID=504468 RepID=A0A5M6IK55_9PROT|nr:hypothetical protein [Rhodovastum atsumiense]KAA5607938.1 hypothetical protein F1189_31450 [Rhodovastum atsumiense]CAH2603812.1 conserved protein of unknown function [Rhodovastum atsumiense]